MTKISPLADIFKGRNPSQIISGGWQEADYFSSPTQEVEQAFQHGAIWDFSSRAKISLLGKDSLSFLHNLSSNDINKLIPGQGCEAFLTTAKAKVIAHVQISLLQTSSEPKILLDTIPDQDEVLWNHLDHYLISEQVEIHKATSDLAMVHVAGPEVITILEEILKRPLEKLQPWFHLCLGNEPMDLIRRNDFLGLPGFDLIGQRETLNPICTQLLKEGITPAGLQALHYLRIKAGYPWVGLDMDDNRFVVEVGRTSAISYTKGCYLGQEPIVMARDRGHINRMLMGILFKKTESPLPSSKIVAEGEEIGSLTQSITASSFNPTIALAYIKRAFTQPGKEILVQTESELLPGQLVSLPFST